MKEDVEKLWIKVGPEAEQPERPDVLHSGLLYKTVPWTG